ncbi:GNAT family N-acetyltransferase [Terasakiella sp.]|uniref:bifunctional acetate--CoA ligase family protein/GNAT family N-acetyltransferase n=1 Tax=Terasakiella sp. TaxID=2034861 RepID=UPI003AA7F348
MGIRNLDKMFAAKSICVIGATNEEGQCGNVVIRNLITGGFQGPIMPVSADYKAIGGILTYRDIPALPETPDLAIVCTEVAALEETMQALGEKGVKAAILVSHQTSCIDEETPAFLGELHKKYGMRILGPNSMGAVVPGKNLNASTHHLPIKGGKIAYVSQSSTMSSTVLDWANAHGVGFSHFISIGKCTGLDFGDIIDYLGSDPFTRAILLYMESIQDQRNFMSAARSAARNKPILVMKSGRHEIVNLTTQTHSGAMAASDLVYDAAFKRAGMLRVNSIAELFAGAETLSVTKPFKGNKLAIVSNGVGLNLIAADHLLESNGKLAILSEETHQKLNDIIGKCDVLSKTNHTGIRCRAQDFPQVYEVLKKSKEADCILFLYSPNIQENSTESARQLVATHKKLKGNILTCWVGEKTVQEAHQIFEENAIPAYSSPRMAITAFMHIVEYLKNQTTLMEIPERVPAEIKPARAEVRQIINEALENGETWLKETDTKKILRAYGIHTVESRLAKDATEAQKVAVEIGFPVVVKILSPDIVHKSDVGGVVLSLENERAVEEAVKAISNRVHKFDKKAQITGFIIQKMVHQPRCHELIAGMAHHPIFGPVLLCGEGGTATEIIADRAIALPPLNMRLADDLISRTKINKLLKGYRDTPPINRNALCQALIELSEICIDFPEIQEFDVNPIFASKDGALAVDSRMRIKKITHKHPNRRLAIRSYPASLEEEFTLRNGRKVLIRPIKPEDEPAHNEFMTHVSPEDIRFRFFGSVRELPHTEMARLTQIDYDREMAFIAQAPNEEDGHMETLGVVRTGTDPNNEDAEYAILVRSDLKGQKLGWKLLNKMIDYCRSRGTTYFTGQILRENRTMLEMVKAMGFEAKTIIEEDIVEVKLKL